MNNSSFPPQKNPSWKKPAKIALALLISCGAVVAMAPTVLSTRVGTSYIAKTISKKTQGKLQIQSLSLSWFGTQEIEGITYSDNTNSVFASCQKISTDSSLISLLFGEHHLGDLLVINPHLKLKKELISYKKVSAPQIAQSSLAYIPPLTPFLQKKLFPVSGRIVIKEGAIDVITNSIDPVYITDIESTIFFARDKSHISFNLDANSSQQEEKGKIAIDGELQNLNTINPTLSINSSISNLPVKALDQIISLIEPKHKGILSDTLGQNLSLTLNGTLSRTDVDLQLQAATQTLNAVLTTQSDGREITLKEPAKISLTLTPELIHRFFPHFDSQPSNVEISLSDLHLPMADTGVNLQEMEIHSQLSFSPLSFEGISLGPIIANVDSKALQTGVSFNLKAPLSHAQKNSSLSASAQITELFSNKPLTNATVVISQLPSQLVDALTSSSYAAEILGDTIDATAKVETTADGSHLYFSILTPSLSIPNSHWKITDTIQLQEPFTTTFVPSDALYTKLFPYGDVIAAAPEPVQLSIESCSIPSASEIDKIMMKAHLQAPLLSFEKVFTFSPYVIKNLSSDIRISSFNDIAIQLKSNLFSFDFEGSYNEKEATLSSKKPMEISYLITDGQIESLVGGDERPHLVSPAQLHLTVQPTTFPLSSDMASRLNIQGKASLDPLFLQNKEATKKANLQQSSLAFDFQGPESLLNAKFNATLTKGSGVSSPIEGSLNASSFLKNGVFDFKNAKMTSHLFLQSVPTSLIQILSTQDIPFPLLIGPNFDLTADIKTSPSSHEISLDAKSAYMQAQVDVSMKEGIISLNKSPGSIRFIITPESYLAFDKIITQDETPPPFTLSEKTSFSFEITEFYIPYQMGKCDPAKEPCVSIDLKNSSLSGTFTNDRLSFADTITKQMIALDNVKFMVLKPKGDAPIKLQLTAEASASKQPNGVVQINAQVSDIYSEQGQIDLSHLSSSIDVNIQKLPTSSIDLFARSLSKHPSSFSSLFGSTLTATLSATLQNATGPIELNVNSPNTRASLVGKLTNGTLTLNEPIYAQIMMTPELSAELLGKVNPLSITEVKSSSPITLEIQPAGFSLPLTTFATNKINIPNVRVELGEISCKNGGNLNIALSLLKSVQLSQNNSLNLWFAPIDLHIDQGVVNIERTDILIAETFDIAFWGVINPVKNNANLVLGLTADCLAQAFNIKNLPEDYVLQVPMTGPLDDIQINKSKATAKIAALLAWQQAASVSGSSGGTAGAIFGHFLNKLGPLPMNDEETPPAKHPFPWENEPPKQKKETSAKHKKTHIKKEDKPLKQIWKILR